LEPGAIYLKAFICYFQFIRVKDHPTLRSWQQLESLASGIQS
jgi:hypothetical protein